MILQFNRILLVAIVAAGIFGLSAAAPAAPNWPAVEYVPANSNPPVPAGLKVTCMTGPTTLTPSNTCPVVRYMGYTTWAYSFIDNRVSLALVTYDSKNNVVSNVTQNGTRYVWNVLSSLPNKTLMFVGQSNQSVTVPWSAILPPPQIVTVAANSNPPVPAGLKVTCTPNGNTGAPSPTCPVVQYQGITTWAYSFIDNRVALAFVSYDAKNNVVRNVTANGTRYVWQITSDPASQTITATGQSNAAVTAPWAQFGP